jgi:hypothetical protein
MSLHSSGLFRLWTASGSIDYPRMACFAFLARDENARSRCDDHFVSDSKNQNLVIKKRRSTNSGRLFVLPSYVPTILPSYLFRDAYSRVTAPGPEANSVSQVLIRANRSVMSIKPSPLTSPSSGSEPPSVGLRLAHSVAP